MTNIDFLPGDKVFILEATTHPIGVVLAVDNDMVWVKINEGCWTYNKCQLRVKERHRCVCGASRFCEC